MLLNELTGKGLQVPKKRTAGLMVSSKLYLYYPPPVSGNWGKNLGDPTGSGLILGPNSPFNKVPLLGSIL